MVLHQGGRDVRRVISVLAALALLAPGAALAASGDWNIYVNASAINRITVAGDSIWCATRGGILIFSLVDSSFVQYLDGLGFRTNDVSGVARDDHGSVWASFTTSGVARIDRLGTGQQAVKLYSAIIDGLMSDSVTCVVSAGSDVYYGSSRGVAKFYEDLHSLEPILSDSLEGVFVHDLLVRGDTLWVASAEGVARFLRGNFNYRMYRIGAATSLCVYGGAVTCAGVNGVQRFNGTDWDQLGKPGSPTPLVPLAITSGAGVLYCVTTDRAFRRDGSSWTDITANMKTMFFQKYRIESVFSIPKTIAVDAGGTLWLAGVEAQINRGAYLSFYRSGSWINKAPLALSQNGIVGLCLGPGGGIWASTRYFGNSYRSSDGRWSTYTKMRTPLDPAGLSYYLNNLAILYDSKGYLWCNALDLDLDRITVNDPLTLSDDEWTHYALNQGTITSNRFVKAKEDPAGNRWFLSDDVNRDQGIYGINILSADGGTWLSINPATVSQMAGGSVFDVAFGPGGVVYLALRGYGVQRWITGGYDWAHLSDPAGDGWATIIEPEKLVSKDLFSIALGGDGAVWVGTGAGLVSWRQEGAIAAIDSLTLKTNPGERGLIGATVYALTFDGAGNLWVGTDQGLNRIAPDSTIDAFTTYSAWRGDLYPSSVISPLPAPTCAALQYDPDENVLWIGTTNGLARLDVTPARVAEKPLSHVILYPNPVHISRGDQKLWIGGISGKVSIRVYTSEGELVDQKDGVEVKDRGERTEAWDLLTLNGFKARSGVYIVKVIKGGQSETRKIAIVR